MVKKFHLNFSQIPFLLKILHDLKLEHKYTNLSEVFKIILNTSVYKLCEKFLPRASTQLSTCYMDFHITSLSKYFLKKSWKFDKSLVSGGFQSFYCQYIAFFLDKAFLKSLFAKCIRPESPTAYRVHQNIFPL